MLLILFFAVWVPVWGQYAFTDDIRLECTDVKNQQRTGTCWCFSTLSMLESQLLTQGIELDLSEMYLVRQIYKDKAQNYILRQGKTQFGEGSLAHDVLRAIDMAGIMPESAYSGRVDGAEHNHGQLEKELKSYLEKAIRMDTIHDTWRQDVEDILDQHLGDIPEYFVWDSMEYVPSTFAEELGISGAQYVHWTSFTHHDFYKEFVLEIPDNYSNQSFYNVPLDQLISAVDKSLEMGYTVAWDGDVSEPGFSARHGLAILPKGRNYDDIFTSPGLEITPSQALRQKEFESYITTDDHLMQIIGRAKDQNGTSYYIIKNSWGELSPYKGLLYMSESYLKMKTVAITFPIQVAKFLQP